MVFSSLFFLYAFLPLCMIVYEVPKSLSGKNWILLGFSIFFYAWGEPFWIIQMLLSGSLVYLCGRLMDDSMRKRELFQSRFFLALGVFSALIPLLVFKYSDFFLENINALFSLSLPLTNFGLPIGISFYTFQIITYIVDLYRGECKVQKRLDYFLLYESFFPQLIAGPIVRYTDIEERLMARSVSMHDRAQGARRFVIGLAKKCLIANYAGSLVEELLAGGRLAQLSGLEALLGILAYTFQIYYDFSAYSDMAIGLGRLFGFRFLENFNYPYISKTVTEFWRRWHMSLGSFFRDYVYIPLGGNRKRHYLNLFITWFLTGFWHGASWNFILWGLYFFVFIVLEKIFLARILDRLPKFVSYLYMLPVIVFGWVLFYFTSLADIGLFCRRLFCLDGHAFLNLEGRLILKQNLLFFLIALVGSLPIIPALKKRVQKQYKPLDLYSSTAYVAYNSLIIFVLLLLSTASLAGSSYNPFLYFRF